MKDVVEITRKDLHALLMYLEDYANTTDTQDDLFELMERLSKADIKRDPIVEAVREKFHGRSQFGLDKYDVGLDRPDLSTRQWMVHLQEELMDATNYVEVLLQRGEE